MTEYVEGLARDLRSYIRENEPNLRKAKAALEALERQPKRRGRPPGSGRKPAATEPPREPFLN